MTPLQKNILAAVKRRPMTLRELQNNLQVDNSRLRTSVSAMVATGELAMKNGTYVPGFATYENPTAPGGSIPFHSILPNWGKPHMLRQGFAAAFLPPKPALISFWQNRK